MKTRGEGRAAGEKGSRVVVPANARRQRRATEFAEEAAWAARSGPVEVRRS
jgi:hypothetical protein